MKIEKTKKKTNKEILKQEKINEAKTVEKTYYQIRKVIDNNKTCLEKNLDVETFKLILANTEKPINEYIKIFKYLPSKAKKNILKSLKMTSESQFKNFFKKKLHSYNNEKYLLENSNYEENEDFD